jgi:hypothetical protein
VLRIPKLTFPFVFELLIWLCYVGMYKYSYLVQQAHLPHINGASFPYLQICGYSFAITLYLIPYYRWAVPKLLNRKRYGWLLIATAILLLYFSIWNNVSIAWLFMQFTHGPLHYYFDLLHQARYVDFNMLVTDLLAFFCLAFARFSHQNEVMRRQIETDHLDLQLSMLKAQLQPHFLFNTLNGLYGMSLTGSKDTPRYILLLSQMMQYILYDCDQEKVDINDELTFMNGYFELEQKKFPAAQINFNVYGDLNGIQVPPLLFLPLIENSFKHGRHKLTDKASVNASLKIRSGSIEFSIVNDVLPQTPSSGQEHKGGIGLSNLNKRLELYYAGGRHQLTVARNNTTYSATLILKHA